ADRAVEIACRVSSVNSGGRFTEGYGLAVVPDVRGVLLYRFSTDRSRTYVMSSRTTNAVRPGTAVNHLELSCVGNTITGRVNGEAVVAAEDIGVQSGLAGVGLDLVRDNLDAEVRFTNLRVTRP